MLGYIVFGVLLPATAFAQPMNEPPANKALQVVVRVDSTAPVVEPFYEVTKYPHVFGRKVERQDVLVDEETHGLANVFLWTDLGDVKPQRPQRRHFIVLANGHYAPYALVANDGDILQFLTIDPVPDVRRPPFPPKVDEFDGSAGLETVFKLEGKYVDRPMRVDSNMYPWVTAYVFVRKRTSCETTDRFGQCALPVRSVANEIEIRLWHSYFENLAIAEASNGVTVVGPGRIRVALDKLGDEPRVEVTVATKDKAEDGGK